MSYRRYCSLALGYVRFKIKRAHPITLTVSAFVALAVIVVTIQFARAGDNVGSAAPASPAAATPGRFLPDGRTNTTQARFDNLCMTPIAGWTKRKGEWAGQWTLEGPDFAKSRVQITGYIAITLNEKGLKAMADDRYKYDKNFIDFKEEAPRVEELHPAGYKMLRTFTSVSAPGYGKDCRLYSMHVYFEANSVASHLEYSAAFRDNFDKYRPVFEDFLKNTRLFSGEVLAPAFDDQPVLEQFTVNQCCDFIEWLIDVPLTDTQRDAARDYFTGVWTRKDKAEANDLWEVFKARNQLDALKKDKKELARQAARTEVIKQWRSEAGKGDKMARMMIDVYDKAQKAIAQGKAGEPPLTRQQSDATLEILHFMASKVAGVDVGPSEDQKTQFATQLAANYASLDLDTKKEMEQMPLYWAWFRAAWPDLSEAERSQCVQQWAKNDRIKPIVDKINELKAKGLAGGDGMAFVDAARKLYQQQQLTAHISNMMAMRHATNMMIINNIGSSNTRYEYRYVYRYR